MSGNAQGTSVYCLTDFSNSACELGDIVAYVQELGLEPGLTPKPVHFPSQLSTAVLSSQYAERTVGDARWWLPNNILRLICNTDITKEGKTEVGG